MGMAITDRFVKVMDPDVAVFASAAVAFPFGVDGDRVLCWLTG